MSCDPDATHDPVRGTAVAADAAALADARRRVRGWIAVAGVFVVLAVSTGAGFYSSSAYITALTTERGFDLTTASFGPTASFVVAGLCGIPAAWLLPRLRVRAMLLVGAAGTAAGLFLLGRADTAAALWGAFALMGAAGALMTVVPGTSLIARWFDPAPGKAITIATTGMSAGGALVPPGTVFLVQRYGFEAAAGLLGLLTIAVVAVVAAVVREPPVVRSPVASTGAARAAAADGTTWPAWTFPVVSVAFGLLMLSQVGTITHLLSIANDRGVQGAEFALTALAVSSVCGRLAGIAVSARLGLLRFSLVIAALQAASLVLTAVADGLTAFVAGAALLGVTVGNAVVLMPLHTLAVYGLPRFDPMFARLNLVSTGGTAGGPVLLGILHGVLDGYRAPLLLLAAGSGLACVLLLACRVDSR
ncbi:MFS transporter [Sphaerisporangium rubeum]|uniref:MFS family permease n=1 Tax=Sphaerisporangium rubeum TaxID=321317 RepID=A0A7X0M7S3_9ACTN|nr:MFS family permease [Sphaerisporangium rubeum]